MRGSPAITEIAISLDVAPPNHYLVALPKRISYAPTHTKRSVAIPSPDVTSLKFGIPCDNSIIFRVLRHQGNLSIIDKLGCATWYVWLPKYYARHRWLIWLLSTHAIHFILLLFRVTYFTATHTHISTSNCWIKVSAKSSNLSFAVSRHLSKASITINYYELQILRTCVLFTSLSVLSSAALSSLLKSTFTAPFSPIRYDTSPEIQIYIFIIDPSLLI